MKAPDKYELTLRIYEDIINGYSTVKGLNDEPIYVKHLKDVDLAHFEKQKNFFEKKGEELGLPSEEEYVKLLMDTNNWSQNEENDYQKLKVETDNLLKTKDKIFLESQKSIIKQRLEDKLKKLDKLASVRNSITIKTAKTFAQEKLNDFIMSLCFYKDKKLKKRLYSYEEYQKLDVDDLLIYNFLYNQSANDFTTENLKRVGHCGLFINSYMLAQSNPFYFFGKKVSDLTSYQTIISSYANGCKNILENSDNTMPNYEDIDDVISWFERESDVIKRKYSSSGGNKSAPSQDSSLGKKSERFEGIGVVGATKEEFHRLAQEKQAAPVEFGKEAQKLKEKLGKDKLGPEDILKLH
tara:strand:+ start:1603 stop:2661 length:1059 start_codon:yes stop_codon:yes gene_type:complete